MPVQEAMGDAAYGDGATRQTFADAGRTLIARVPGRPDRQRFPKNDFVIDLVAGSCTCPAGQVTHTIVPAGRRTDAAGRIHHLQAFQFDGSECMTCPLRSQCISAKGRKGRRVLIHPQEALLQQARALQQSAGYDEYRARRVVVRAQIGPTGPVGHSPVPLLRTRQDAIPAVPSGYSGQPDPGGGQNRAVGQCRRWASAPPRRPQCRPPVMSRLFPTVWSPMLRPFSALSGSDCCGPRFCSPRLYCRNLSPHPGLFGPASRWSSRAGRSEWLSRCSTNSWRV